MRSLFLIFLLISFKSYSQKEFVINPGQKISDVLAFNDIYKYSAFKPGTVFFKNGNQSSALLNYNFLNQVIQFIQTNGDTLALGDEELIKEITIEKDTFYFDRGYFLLLEKAGDIKLFSKEFIRFLSSKKRNSYNQTVEGGARVFNSISTGAHDSNLVINETVTLRKETAYFLADKFNHSLPINKKNLEKLFPKFKSNIENYLSSTQVNFNQAEDVLKLFQFLGTL